MNALHTVLILSAAAALTACATTPEQKAARAAAQKRYEQNLQISLAAQCDKATAELMRQQFEQADNPPANRQTKRVPPEIRRQSRRPDVPSLLQDGVAELHRPAAVARGTLLL